MTERLRNLFAQCHYKHPERVVQECCEVWSAFGRAWKINIDENIFRAWRSWFYLEGLVRVTVKGIKYTVQVGIGFPLEYPEESVTVFQLPTECDLIMEDGSRLFYGDDKAYYRYFTVTSNRLVDIIDNLANSVTETLERCHDIQLYGAARSHDRIAVRQLLSLDGFNVARTQEYYDPMRTSVDSGDTDIVLDLLEAGAWLPDNIMDKLLEPREWGGTRSWNKAHMTDLLLEHGAVLQSQPVQSLYWEALCCLECFHLLSQHGCDVVSCITLRTAVRRSCPTVAEVLIQAGAEIDYSVITSAVYFAKTQQTLSVLIKHAAQFVIEPKPSFPDTDSDFAWKLWGDAAKNSSTKAIQLVATAVPTLPSPSTVLNGPRSYSQPLHPDSLLLVR